MEAVVSELVGKNFEPKEKSDTDFFRVSFLAQEPADELLFDDEEDGGAAGATPSEANETAVKVILSHDHIMESEDNTYRSASFNIKQATKEGEQLTLHLDNGIGTLCQEKDKSGKIVPLSTDNAVLHVNLKEGTLKVESGFGSDWPSTIYFLAEGVGPGGRAASNGDLKVALGDGFELGDDEEV
ncbi:hypothetical protein QOT17_003086 [Balamuthia mandrillaris]